MALSKPRYWPLTSLEMFGLMQHVVQRGVELLQVRCGPAGGLHPVEDGVPLGVGVGPHGGEVEARLLGVEVGLRVGLADERDADLDLHDGVRRWCRS